MSLWLILLAAAAQSPTDAEIAARVDRVLTEQPVIDGHNDLAWEIRNRYDARVESVDLTSDTSRLPYPLQTDLPRLKKGHVGGQFWSVWIPAETLGPRAVELTLEQIDIVRRMVAAYPDALAMASNAADLRRIAAAGRTASLIGVEGGHQIDGRLSVLRVYHDLGVRYMTLTHTKSLPWADASTDAPRTGGLSAFGRKVVLEMNRIGMMIDVSHVSDDTMLTVLALSAAPVIASHSNARAIDNAPRNIPDDLLIRIGVKGGVVMVNFYPSFVSQRWRDWDAARTAYAASVGVAGDIYGNRAPGPMLAWDRDHPAPRVTTADVADHVERIARVAGRQGVGIGSDFDGIDGTSPDDMTGVDAYPRLFAELARRGWSDADLMALAGGNVLRVMEQVEAVAAAQADRPPIDATDVP